MKKTYFLLLPLVCSAPLLPSCGILTKQPDTAMHVEPLLRIHNSDRGARGFYQLGRYLQGQNRLPQAEEAYRKALAQQADYIDAQNALGAIYSTQGKFDEAIAQFSAILEKNPRLARIHNNLGFTFYLQGNYADAVTAFDKAIALEPNNPRTLNNLALAHQKLGNPEKTQFAQVEASVLSLLKATAEIMHVNTITNIDESTPLPTLTSGEGLHLKSPAQASSVALDNGQMTGTPQNAVALTEKIPAMTASSGDQALETFTSEVPQLQSIAAVTNDLISVHSLPARADQVQKNKAFNFEISNGNGIADLAKKVADTLVRNGFPSAHISNLKPFQQARTVIRYRDGFYSDAAHIVQRLSTAPVLILDTQMRKNTDVQLILGKDAITHIALLGSDSRKIVLNKHRPTIRASWPTKDSDVLSASIPQGL